jgi:hypothetical protein
MRRHPADRVLPLLSSSPGRHLVSDQDPDDHTLAVSASVLAPPDMASG